MIIALVALRIDFCLSHSQHKLLFRCGKLIAKLVSKVFISRAFLNHL